MTRKTKNPTFPLYLDVDEDNIRVISDQQDEIKRLKKELRENIKLYAPAHSYIR